MAIKFANISNHQLTKEQIDDLKNMFQDDVTIMELPEEIKKEWSNLTPDTYICTVHKIINWIYEYQIRYARIAGFVPAVLTLNDVRGLKTFYSFFERVSEEKEVNGEVIKVSKFQHKGWYRY